MLPQSYVHGSAGPPLVPATIGALLDYVAERYAEREAIVSVAQGIRWTYADLKGEADRLAAGLISLGLVRGDAIGIWAPNRAEWVALQYGAAKAGLILVSINPAYQLNELEHVLNVSGCAALVIAKRFKGSNYAAMVSALDPVLTVDRADAKRSHVPALRHVIALDPDANADFLPYATLRTLGEDAGVHLLPTADELDMDQPVNIQFTSGTTGAAKGVTLSQHNIVNNAIQTGAAAGIREGDRVCVPVPLFHCFGMTVGNLACLGHAATAVYPAEAFDPVAVMGAVEAEGCTHLYGVPTMMIAILGHERFRDFDLSSLRGGIIGGAPCPREIMKAVMTDLHMPEVTIIYGMTETSPVSFQTRPDDPFEARVSTVGRILPHLEVKIVDNDGHIVPLGESGELCTRGYSVMAGYWGEPDKTRDVLGTDGWMHTGDLATLDGEGYCRIIGRSKDLVIRGGENISPREVEEYLHRHPAILDVQVFGVPDARFGEELCAWIVLRSGSDVSEDEIRAFCQGQIAHYKIPRYVRLVDGFPMTASGKAQKFQMRERMVSEFAFAASPS